jgi:hypothetical protein
MIKDLVEDINWVRVGLVLMAAGTILVALVIRAVVQYQLLISSVTWNSSIVA